MAQTGQQTEKQGLLLDTSILYPLTERKFRRRILRYLTTLADQYDFAISEISIFEIFRMEKNGEHERNFYRRLLDSREIKTLEISSPIVQNAWILCRCAHPNAANGDSKKNLTPDMIIGGSVSSNSRGLLLTSDRSDFCAPFWDVIDKHFIVVEDGEKFKTQTIYLLRFNYCALDREYLTDEMLTSCTGNQITLALPPGEEQASS